MQDINGYGKSLIEKVIPDVEMYNLAKEPMSFEEIANKLKQVVESSYITFPALVEELYRRAVSSKPYNNDEWFNLGVIKDFNEVVLKASESAKKYTQSIIKARQHGFTIPLKNLTLNPIQNRKQQRDQRFRPKMVRHFELNPKKNYLI